MNLFADLLILFLLLMLNGVFAMAEIAVVSSRKARLKKLADEGSTRASVALALANSPDRFLSTVQIGITLVGVLAGAFGGAALSDEFEPMIAAIPVLAPYAGIISRSSSANSSQSASPCPTRSVGRCSSRER
jgi:putative hemolysin